MAIKAARPSSVVTAVAVAALAVAGIAGLTFAAKGGTGNGNGNANGPDPKPLVVSGSVEGLLPGVPNVLNISVTNSNKSAIAVRTVTVSATDASAGCPASVLSFTPRSPGQRIAAEATALVPVSVIMAADAPDACQGSTFPLRYTVTATKAK
jgi:hypothetical protein